MHDRERRALAIFQECLDVASERRMAYLLERCGDDGDLVTVARRLLELHEAETAGDSADVGSGRDPRAIVSAAASALARSRSPRGDCAGLRLGPWEVIERIGAGGMGEVFRGRRADGAFDKEVAIKLLRADTADPEVAARFLRERRVLAALDHENVARLLDAGADEAGDPFLVMEHVRGEPIDGCCDRLQLDVMARIRLFLEVCDAVHHAHGIGVLHRDLKPANILVAQSDDGASRLEPKLLDFGIAGLLGDARIQGDATLTIDALRYMTPAYASPEQIRRQPLTPASDIYSLAVLLYELLTGVPPLEFAARSPVEIERIVSEETPVAPSASAESTTVASEKPSPEERARRRKTTPAALRRALRGDLDRIVMMALRKEPERRYASVADFADDLRRFLDGRPVHAQRDTIAYRMARFAHRNRIPVAVFSIVLAAITTALAVALDALEDTRLAKADAEIDRTKAIAAQTLAEEGLEDSDAVTAFLTEMLASGEPWEMGREVSVREVLDRAAAEVETRFGTRPLIAARIHATIGRSYTRLGVLEPARHHAERALALFSERLPDTDARVRDALFVVAMMHKASGRHDLALIALERGLAATILALGDHRVERWALENDIAGVLRAMDRFDLAEPRFRAAIEGFVALGGDDAATLCQPTNNLGLLLVQTKRFAEAREWLERSRRLHEKHRRADHPETLVVDHNRANLLVAEGRHAEALEILEPLLARFEAIFGDHHPQTNNTRHLTCNALAELGRREEALTLRERILELAQAHHGLRSIEAGVALLRASEQRFRSGEIDLAEEMTFEALSILEAVAPPEHPDRPRAHRAHSVVNSRLGKHDAALQGLEASIRVLLEAKRDDDEIGRAYFDLMNLYSRAGDAEGAIRAGYSWLDARAIERQAATDRSLVVLRNTGANLANRGRRGEAMPLLVEAYLRICERDGVDAPVLAKVLEALERASPPDSTQRAFWANERARHAAATSTHAESAPPARNG